MKSAKKMNGASICAPSGSTTELDVADYFRALKMTFKPVIIEDADQIRGAFFSGRCDVYTGDKARLDATRAANTAKPDDDEIANYGEAIDRGLNRLWTESGLQYAPPIR